MLSISLERAVDQRHRPWPSNSPMDMVPVQAVPLASIYHRLSDFLQPYRLRVVDQPTADTTLQLAQHVRQAGAFIVNVGERCVDVIHQRARYYGAGEVPRMGMDVRHIGVLTHRR